MRILTNLTYLLQFGYSTAFADNIPDNLPAKIYDIPAKILRVYLNLQGKMSYQAVPCTNINPQAKYQVCQDCIPSLRWT